MNLYIYLIVGISGIYSIIMALITKTQNFMSALLFKVISFFLEYSRLEEL
mgnify:CR=1 FL=1